MIMRSAAADFHCDMACAGGYSAMMNRMAAVAAWIMQENPQATVKLVADFLAK
jgi:hypothetical protein